jgi:hypothetical protein
VNPQSKSERFWSKVEKTETCWLWTRAKYVDGYGVYCHEGRQCRAHRFAYEWFVGPIPEGLYVCHICDVRHCVRPDHLFLGTQRENSEDMVRKGRQSRGLEKSLIMRGRAVRGEAHHRSKLTDEQVRQIREDYAHLSLNEAAKIFGVGFSSIGKIRRGERRTR